MKICTETNTVITKYSVDFLSARHNGPNNKDQALKVYRGQCNRVNKYRGVKYKCTQAFEFAEG